MTIRDRGIEHITQIKLRNCEANLASLRGKAGRSAERLMTGTPAATNFDMERAYLNALYHQIEDTERQIAQHRASLDSLNATKPT